MINVISAMLQSVTDESNKNMNSVYKEDNEFGKLLETMSLQSDIKIEDELKVEDNYNDAELEISYKIEDESDIKSEDSSLSKRNDLDKDNSDNKVDKVSEGSKNSKKATDIKNDRYITLVNSLNSKFKENSDFISKEKAGVLLENSTGKIKIKFSSLDEATKEKIKKSTADFNAGRLTKAEFNVALSQIILNGETGKNLRLKAKGASIENVELKVAQKENKSQNVLNPTNFISKIKTEAENPKFNSLESGDKNDISKIAVKDVKKKTNILETSNNKTEIKSDVDIKDFKTEINLLNKTVNIENKEGVVKNDNPKTLLLENKESIFEQLAKNTKITMNENLTKFSTMIRPDNIGRMDFHITVKDGKMNGKIILQNQEAVDFFRANTEEMRAIFQKSAVEMERIDVALAGQNGQSFSFDDKNFREQNKSEDMKIGALFTNKIRNIFEDNNMIAGNYSAGSSSTVNLFI